MVLRLSALAVLVLGVAGVTLNEMPPSEAGRLYLIALGLYLISPAEQVKKGDRKLGTLLRQKRYLSGAICLVLALLLIALQFTLNLI